MRESLFHVIEFAGICHMKIMDEIHMEYSITYQ